MERGQASIEWLGAIALVAVVLIAAAGVTGGDAIASSVVRGIHRALCVVRGGVCDLDRRPCVVEANSTQNGAHVNLGFVRIGRDELILREHRADGSVLVTYLHDTSGGWDVGTGSDAWISVAGQEVLAGSAARIALLASLGGGQTWTFDDALDADVAMSQLGEGRTPTLGRRTATVESSGLGLAVDAHGAVSGVHGTLRLDARRVHAVLVDEHLGARTQVVRRDGAAAALIQRRRDRAEAVGAAGEQLSVTSAADGTPLELAVVRSGELGGELDLPGLVQPVADELLGGASAGHRRWVVEQRLDLTDPANLAAAHELLQALDGPLPVLAGASDALRDRLAAAGITEARTYDVDRDAGGLVAHAAAGIKVGGGLTDETDDARLVSSRVRGPDGAWRVHPACG